MDTHAFPIRRSFRFLAGLFFLAAFASWLPAAVDLRDGGAAEHHMTPAAPQLNVPFTFQFTVENAGETEAVGAEAVFYLSTDQVPGNAGDILLARVALPAISSKAPAKVTTNLTITSPGGPWRLIWVLEHREETNARDNIVIYANQITVAAPPTGFDLADAGTVLHSLTPASRQPGQSFDVTASVRNLGPAASPAFSVSYYLSTNATYENTDVFLGSVNGPAIAAPTGGLVLIVPVGTSLTVPAGQEPGTYRIIYLIKSEADANQANNTVLLGPSLTVTSPPRTGFDLADAGAALRSISPTSVTSGQNITVQASVRNAGPDASPAFSVEYRLSTNDTFGDGDDVILGTQPGAAMPAPPLEINNPTVTPVGRTLTIPAGQTPGAYRLLLRIIAPADTNQANNTVLFGATLTVTAPPVGTVDLVDAGASFRSLHPAPYFMANTPLNVSGTIRNNGTVASGPFTLAFFASRDQTIGDADDIVLSLHSMPAVPPTLTTFIMAPFQVQVPTTLLQTGVSYYIGWRIVGGNDSNEANNAILMSGFVRPLPPPAVQFVGNWTVSGERVAYWDSRFRLSGLLANNAQDTDPIFELDPIIELKAEFRRVGQIDPVWVINFSNPNADTLVNGEEVTSSNWSRIYKLLPGQHGFTIDFRHSSIKGLGGSQQLPAGFYQVKLTVRDIRMIDPLDTHNIPSVFVADPSKPDLQPYGAGQITPQAVQPGGTVTISGLEVRNYGKEDAPASTVRFFANDTPLGSHLSIPAIPRPRPFKNNSKSYERAPIPATTVTLPAGLGEGEVELFVMVDSMEAIDEDAELNNRLSLGTVTVGFKPDLRPGVKEHLHFPEALLPGIRSSLSGWVTNLGLEEAGAFAVRFYLTTNAASRAESLTQQGILLGTVDSSPLPSQGTRELHLLFTVPIGTSHDTYYFAMWIDPTNAIDEWNENNNIFISGPVQVGPVVNLKPGSTPFALSTDEVVRGGTVTLTGSRANTGTIAAPDHRCWVVLSTDEEITRDDRIIDNAFFAEAATPASADAPLSLALTVAAPPGTYHVGYIFDATNQVTELNEDDNIVLLPGLLHIVEPPFPGQPVPAPEWLEFDLFKTDAFFRWTSQRDVPYLIEGSDNARDWRTLDEVPGNTGAATEHWLLDAAPANQPFRLFRVRVK